MSWNENDKITLFNYNEYTKVLVSKEVMKLVDALSTWTTIQEISDKFQISKKALKSTLEQLSKLQIIDKNIQAKQDTIISDTTLWDPIDLAMQRQRSYGGSYPMSDRVGKSPDPLKHMEGISSIKLQIPQITSQNSRSLFDILEDRKSDRRYGNRFLTLEELSNFLYHTARVKRIVKSKNGALTRRPYPSGGARYALEIYVVNNRIKDIKKGIHFYDPLNQQLNLISENSTYRRKFNIFTRDVSAAVTRDPDVIFIITAVFARTMWKYDKLSLSLMLTDLGCLYQTMYLVATQMNLAPCPIGKTQEHLVKNWLNLNWFEESHIGTFLLGVPEKNQSKNIS
jgi:SagB-type dehydrogenase family enzyme